MQAVAGFGRSVVSRVVERHLADAVSLPLGASFRHGDGNETKPPAAEGGST
jgi:hypothetical protein